MTTNTNSLLHTSSITAAVLASAGLATELYLFNKGKSLCHTEACAVVANYVRFGEPVLLVMGACFFLLTAASIFFAKRYPKQKLLAPLPLLILAGAASFDGALIGFQFITLGQRCLICILVAASLALTALLYSASLKKWSIAILCFAAWGAGFMANSILIMPDIQKGANSGMIFYQRGADKEIRNPDAATFIFSLNCSHCKEVLEYLSEKNPTNTIWRFAIIDRKTKTLNKLGHFYEHAATSDNPFKLLLESKEKNATLDPKILEEFPNLTRQARVYMNHVGLYGVPILIIDTDNKKQILNGSTAILNYLKEHENE